ncbi:MAG: hypothetical protein IJ722_04065 [Alloprevotella sp.]|nr:hypothetical protein [Alloprevotella sp.]
MNDGIRQRGAAVRPAWWPRAVVWAAAAFCAAHLAVTLGWVFAPGVNEYREWAQADAALRIFSPGGPYGGGAEEGIYLYGLLYPLLGGALHRLVLGDVLVELRLLSYALTWCTALVAARMLWRRTGEAWVAALGCALLLVVDWQNVTGTATPAPLGSLLLLLAIGRAEARKPVAAGVLSALCFFVKPYFVAVCLPLFVFFCFRSRRAALRYSAAALLSGLAMCLSVKAVFPYYFAYNVVHHLAAASAVWGHLGRQVLIGALIFSPLFAVALLSLRRPRAALRADAAALCAVLLCLVWLRLGLHAGAFMSYAYHLCLPPLVVFSLSCVPALRLRWRGLFALSVLAIPIVGGSLWLNLPLPPRGLYGQGRTLAAVVPSGAVNLSPAMARTAYTRGLRSLDNGQGQYVSSLYSDRPAVLALFPEVRDLRRRAQTFEPELHGAVASGRWAWVVSDARSIVPPAAFRQAGYAEQARRTLRVGVHDIDVFLWKK